MSAKLRFPPPASVVQLPDASVLHFLPASPMLFPPSTSPCRPIWRSRPVARQKSNCIKLDKQKIPESCPTSTEFRGQKNKVHRYREARSESPRSPSQNRPRGSSLCATRKTKKAARLAGFRRQNRRLHRRNNP